MASPRLSPPARPSPHPWQQQAAERALRENIIVSAETGAGKTLVALLAAQGALATGKVAIMAPSRLLAHQQADRASDFFASPQVGDLGRQARVVEVTGYTASKWGKREWDDCRSRYDVFVGTPEIFRKALIDTAFLRVEEFSLFVVDECHHVSGKSDMAALMALLHWDPQGERRRPHARVRVLGLTASIVKCRAEDRARFERDRQRLVDAMQANIEACAAPPRAPPTFREVSWPLPGEDVARERRTLAEGLVSLVLERVAEQGARSSGKTLGKVVRAAGVVLEELGRDAFVLALEHGVVAQIEARIDDWKRMPEREAAARALEGRLGGCRAALEEATAQVKERLRQAEQVQPVSDKVKALARALRETCDQQLHGMVFVSEVSLAVPLARLLQDELGLAVEVTSGVGSMREKDRNDAFWRFRSGRSPILVCTDCAEEGVDVSACAFVVRFSAFRTSKAHVQGAGRARLPRATVFYMHNHPQEEIRRADLMREVAEDASLPGPRATRECLPPGFERIPGVHPLVCPRTGAQVNFGNAQKLLQVYVAKVTGGQGSLEAEAALEGEEDDLAPTVPLLVGAARSGASGLVVPGPCGGCFLAEAEVHRFFAGAAGAPGLPAQPRLCLCYVAVLVLRSRGWLDGHNCVPEGVVRQTAWPVEIGSVPVLSLRPGWRPPGLLGADREAAPARPPAPRGGESPRRRHAAGGAEQAKLEAIWLDPLAIENTQKTVNRTFSNGECVFRLMVALVLGTSRAAELPPMRVSFDEGSRRWFSADNRRCFAMKVVAPLIQLQSVEVDPINWTSEMGNKLNQRTIVGDVWATTQESIEAVRQEVAAAAQSMPEGAEHGAETDHEAADATAVAMAAEVARRLQESGAGAESAAAHLPVRTGRPGPRLALRPYVAARAAQAPGAPSRDTAVEPARELGGNCSGCGGGDPGRGIDGAPLAPQEDHSPTRPRQPPAAHPEAVPLHAPGPAGAPPERAAGERGRILGRVAESLALAAGPQDRLMDPISALNLAVMGHFKPHGNQGEEMPLSFQDADLGGGAGFAIEVTVCDLKVVGPRCDSKKIAKREAAHLAVRRLVEMAAGDA